MGNVRIKEADSQQQDLLTIQRVQNKLLRLLNNSKLIDCINTNTLLSNVKMLSVKRLNAQIKLTESWKSQKIENYNLNIKLPLINTEDRSLRSGTQGKLKETGISKVTQNTFIKDCKKMWNNAPAAIRMCETPYSAKKEMKKYVNTLPI